MQMYSRPNTNSRPGLMYKKNQKKFTNTRVVSCQMDGAAEGTKIAAETKRDALPKRGGEDLRAYYWGRQSRRDYDEMRYRHLKIIV